MKSPPPFQSPHCCSVKYAGIWGEDRWVSCPGVVLLRLGPDSCCPRAVFSCSWSPGFCFSLSNYALSKRLAGFYLIHLFSSLIAPQHDFAQVSISEGRTARWQPGKHWWRIQKDISWRMEECPENALCCGTPYPSRHSFSDQSKAMLDQLYVLFCLPGRERKGEIVGGVDYCTQSWSVIWEWTRFWPFESN